MKSLIKYNATNLIELCSPDGEIKIKLIPGVNQVDEAAWNEVKKHPMAKHLLEDYNLEELKTGPVSNAFTKMKENEQIKLISETNDKALLEEWAGQVKNAKVQKAILKKLDDLEIKPEEMPKE